MVNQDLKIVQTALLANVYHNNSLFGSSPLPSDIPSILDPHQDSSQISLIHGDPAALVLQNQPIHILQQLIDDIDVGVDQLKAQDLGLGGGQPTSSPEPVPKGTSVLHCPGEGKNHLSDLKYYELGYSFKCFICHIF